jgi:tryptophan-rich hypothetical protein
MAKKPANKPTAENLRGMNQPSADNVAAAEDSRFPGPAGAKSTLALPSAQANLPMTSPTALRLQTAKLLRSKWTAAVPVNKEKHFIVTALIAPESPGTQFDVVAMEAVLTGRSFTLRWRELNDATQWLQGWR